MLGSTFKSTARVLLQVFLHPNNNVYLLSLMRYLLTGILRMLALRGGWGKRGEEGVFL